ncbi:MAG: ABC transporter ATP-binding protein [Pseudomonadota bacterium]
MPELGLKRVSVVRGDRTVLQDVSVQFSSGELVAILGANGSGKSTLVRSAIGIQIINSGIATINKVDSHKMSAHDRARAVAYLPQIRTLSWPLTVRDTVALGRFAHGARLGKLGVEDEQAVHEALTACDLQSFAMRRVDALSGGELARVHCARALASQAALFVADEPTAELDPWHQFRLMELIRGYVNEGGGAVVIMHDPELAARYADRLLWMVDGRIVDDGPVMTTLSATRLAQVYQMEADVFWRHDQPQVTWKGLADSPAQR